MKKVLLSLLPMLLVAFVSNAQVQRLVMVESFTQASCGPCATYNPGFDALLDQNPEKVVVLKYQTSWPGFDPMNEQNPGEVQTRVDYYGVDGVPNVHIDGNDVGSSANPTQTTINNAYAVPAELEMSLVHEFSDDLKSVTINCDVTNPDMMNEFNVSDAYLRVAISERDIVFPGGAPGSNGESHFNWVMRKMLPDALGTLVGTIAPGATVNFTWTVDIPDYIYDYSEIAAVAFVQKHGSKKMYQAAVSNPLELPAEIPNSAYATNTVGPNGLCEYELTPIIIIENDGDLEITFFDASYSINEEDPVVDNWTGSLMPGEEVTIEFPTIAIDPGEANLSYNVSNVNGFPDTYAHNDNAEPESYYTLEADPVGPVIEKGFEGVEPGENPDGVIVQKDLPLELAVVDADFLGGSSPAGGYGDSQQSLFFYFWGIQSFTSNMIFQKMDWNDRVNNMISFDVAYRQYQAENDRLRVYVSTDCGVSWDQVFNKAGSALSTLSPNTANYLNPGANDWRTEEIDLTEYDGAEEIVVRFSATSAYGNNMYIDNINLGGSMVSGVEDVIAEGNVNVYPNPTNGPVSVDFTMLEADKVTVQIFDVTGKLMNTLASNQSFGAGAHSLEWNTNGKAANGLYFVKFTTTAGQVTQKVNVVK